MKVTAQSRNLILALGILAATGAGSTVSAASPCQGLAPEQCAGNTACLWVDGYTRKDGRSVKGYCRIKGGKTSSRPGGASHAVTPGATGRPDLTADLLRNHQDA